MVYGIATIVFRGWASWSRVAPEIHLAHQEEVPRETLAGKPCIRRTVKSQVYPLRFGLQEFLTCLSLEKLTITGLWGRCTGKHKKTMVSAFKCSDVLHVFVDQYNSLKPTSG